jgi:hypothetical protein
MKMAAVDRDSQRVLATTELQLTVQGTAQNIDKVFNKSLTTVFVQRGKIILSFI